MKTAFACGVLGVLVGVAIVYTVGPHVPAPIVNQGPKHPQPKKQSGQAPSTRGSQAGMSRTEYSNMLSRVKALEIDLKELRIQVNQKRRLKGGPQPSAPATTIRVGAADANAVTVDALKQEDSKARAIVEQMVTDAMRNQRAERRELRRAFWAARSEDKLDDFAKKAEIPDKMVNQIAVILQEERKKIGAQYRQMRETLDVREGREAIKDIRNKTNETVKGMLSTEQAEMWDDMRNRRGRW